MVTDIIGIVGLFHCSFYE